MAILNACSDGERAFEVESLGRGLLSLALERQLRAAATSNQHWMVTPGSAGTLQDEMQGIARGLGHRVDQRPWLSELLSPVVLYRPPIRPAPPAPVPASSPGMVMPSMKAAVATREGIAANAGVVGSDTQAAAPELADELKVRYRAAIAHLQAGRWAEGVPMVEVLAEQEYPDAMNHWALWLAYGGRPELPEKDPAEAERLWRRTIERGNLPAMGNLGDHLRAFAKSPERTQEGLSLLIQAAAQGLVSAAVRLSAIRAADDEALHAEAKSRAFPSDEQLRSWLQVASLRIEAEDASAWIQLAAVAAYGAPGLRSPEVVDRFIAIWSRASVDDGPGEPISENAGGHRHAAMVLAAHLLSLKADLSSEDAALPRSLLTRLAKATGGLQPGAALLHFAWSAEGGYNGFAKSAQVAEALLRTGSDNDAPDVLFALSRRLLHGRNLIHQDNAVPTDQAKALDYLHRAAQFGHAEAMVDLVHRHSHGYAVAKDFRLARQWADRAMALNLSPISLATLGECFLTGDGAMHDDETAATIYYRCLHQGKPDTGFYGQPDAMLVFGLMHWFGKGLKQDRAAGQQWFNRSVDATQRETWHRSSPEASAAEQEFRIGLALASPRDDYGNRCHHLQLLHRMGIDREAARPWNERSAAHGNQDALSAYAHSLAGADDMLERYSSHEFPDLGLRWEPAQAEEAMQHLLKSGHARAGWLLIRSLSAGASTRADVQLEAIFERLYELDDDKAAVAQAADNHYKAASTSPNALRLRALWSQRALQHRPPAQLADADTTGLARQPGESALGQLKRLAAASSADKSPSAIEAFRLTDSVELANVLEARLLRARWLMRGFGTDADCDAALAVMQDCVARFGASHRLDLADGIAGLFIGDRWDSSDTHFSDYSQVGALLMKLDTHGSFAAHLVQALLLVEGCCGVPRDLERAQVQFHALFDLDAQRAEEMLIDQFFDPNRPGRRFRQLLRRPPNADSPSSHSHQASLCATTAIFRGGIQSAKAMSAAYMADAFAGGFITEVPKPHYIRQDEPDSKAAAAWLLRAAEAGDLTSIHQLAEPLAKSASSAGRALQWWAKAAEAGDLDAMAAIGVLLMDHPQLRSELPPEKASSEYWFDYAASVADAANLKIAQRLFKPGDSSRIELTTTWLQRSLDKAPSQAAWFLLAACRAHAMPGARGLEAADRCVETGLHLHGEPGGGDYERASALWRDDGPCPASPDRVLRYLRLAADKGNISGDWELGQAFATGYGGKPDRAQAEASFLRCLNLWISRSRLVYWWARWGRVDKWAEAEAFFRQDMANMEGQDESDCIYQLAFASLERAATGKVALAEEAGWLGYAFFKDANSDYRLPLQQAVFLMELPKRKASQIARARDCLDVAAKLVRLQPANDLIAVEHELAFIETQRRKLATIKPMGWAARLAFRSPDPYL